MKISTDSKKIDELLTRGVEEVIVKEHLDKQLRSGKKLRVKLGIDPTSPHLHLGRSAPILKLRDFQELGHQAVFIVGDFTGVIGDTSDKDAERPMLAKKIVEQNLKTYREQAGKLIDLDQAEIRYNSEWLKKIGYDGVGHHADAFSLHEFIMRENISRRLEAGTRISLREVLYPLMQGYDSVAVKADVELGGTDQRFNLLAGRRLQEHFGQEPQDIVMNPLVEGTDGRKMSSSWGNTINFTDAPEDMYGKVMTVADNLIGKYLDCFTRIPLEETARMKNELHQGGNPRDYKMKLAHELVTMYHSKKAADKAQEYFVSTFTRHEIPEDISDFKPSHYDIVTVLVESKLVSSKAEARRAIEQGGVKVNEHKIDSFEHEVKKGDVVQKGKRFFVRVV